MKRTLPIYKSETDRDFELKKLEFEKSFELRSFEIDNLWKRALIFGALLLALATGYYNCASNTDKSIKSYCLYISFFAFLLSLIQGFINRGSKYWQERWELKTKNTEDKLNIGVTRILYKEFDYTERQMYAHGGNLFTRPVRYSVSKLTVLVSDLVTIFCFAIWLKDCGILYICQPHIFRKYAFFFHLFIFLYIILFLFLKSNWLKGFKRKKKWWKKIPLKFNNGGGGKVYMFFKCRKKEENKAK